MSGDSRKDFILATLGNYFGYSPSDGAISHIQDSRELNNFLDDGNCTVLATHAELTQDVRLIQVYNNIDSETTSDNSLVFYKLQPTVITPDNLHSNVFISSLLDSPFDTLYHSVQKVFAPVLLKDEKWSKSIDPKIQVLLTELEAGLGSALRRLGRSGTGELERGFPPSETNVSGILTPSDEFQFWAEASMSSTRLSSRERSQHFQELFQPIVTEFANLDSLSFTEALELVEVTQDSLDDLWKQTEHEPGYPEVRMRHLLEVLSGAFGRFVQRKLSDLDIWSGQFSYVRGSLHDGLMVCERWGTAAEVLTTHYWKQYTPHRWEGVAFSSPGLSQLVQRVEEVLGLRTVHEQLLCLLSSSEEAELNLLYAFSPFAGGCGLKVGLCVVRGGCGRWVWSTGLDSGVGVVGGCGLKGWIMCI